MITIRSSAVPVDQADLNVLALQSPRLVMDEVAREFESRMSCRIVQLAPRNEMPVHILKRIARGEAFDVAFLIPAMLDELAVAGHIVPATRTRFMRVPIGLAVRAGSARPDIRTVDAFTRAVLNARSIAFLRAGVSGPHLQGLFEVFGIAGEIEGKSLRPETDSVGELVAQGDAEIGITAISTLIATRGIDVVGPIPNALQAYVEFEGAMSATASRPDIARALLSFSSVGSVAEAIRNKGMEPWPARREAQ